MDRFGKYLELPARKVGLHKVFSDFLQIIVCCLSAGAKEPEYLELIGRYEKNEVEAFCKAFASLVDEMDNGGDGLKDCFGDWFMEHLSNDRNGQFFTPEHVCDLMAQMSHHDGNGLRIIDCCCGSGRMLLAAARIERNNFFFGSDIDITCARMCAINFCLNGMFGEVACMDAISNRFTTGWVIESHPEYGIPYLREIEEDESVIVLKLPEHKEDLPKMETVNSEGDFLQGKLFKI